MVKVIMDVSALKDQKKGIVLQSTVRPIPFANRLLLQYLAIQLQAEGL